MTPSSICPGCGAWLPTQEGPTHAYMLSSPACWAAFGQVLAAEYSSSELMQTHRLSVDTYAVQHPGDGSRTSIQSVGLHLARLMLQLDRPRPPRETHDVMLHLGKQKHTLIQLQPPRYFRATVADMAPAVGTPNHSASVQAWARSTWEDWAAHHEYIRQWVGASGSQLS